MKVSHELNANSSLLLPLDKDVAREEVQYFQSSSIHQYIDGS